MILLKKTFTRSVLLLCLASIPVSLFAQAFVNFEGKHTAPIRLSPDGSRLFAVNTPDSRLSVFDVSNPQNPILIAEIPVGLEPVSVNPVSNDEAWVVNEVSDSVSVVSVSQRVVTDTLYVKDEPADVVFAKGRAFVTCARNNQISVFDAVTHASITNIPVFGENPRSMCVSENGNRLYAAFALSGNRTTLVPFQKAPPQPPPTNPNLPPPPPVSLIVDAADPVWTNGVNAPIKYTMPDNDIVEIDTTTLSVARYFSRVGTVNFAIAVWPGIGDLIVANTDARNLTRFEPTLRGGFVTNQISLVHLFDSAVTRYDLNPGFTYTNFPNLSNQSNALAQPTAIAFEPESANFYLTAFGSDRVAKMNAKSGQVLARIDINPTTPGAVANPRTKRGPRGLALKSGALYVFNRVSNTITVIDPSSNSIVREIPVGSHDPTPQVIREGRGFLYDAKLSGGGLVSCASCHIDGEMDMLAWDLGNPGGSLETNAMAVSGSRGLFPPNGIVSNVVFHPMKGPMTTQTLRGLAGMDPLHWRGDRTNFAHFNGAFDSLLGGPALSISDMTAYRAFINTIVFQANPNQNLNRTLPAGFGDGDPTAGRNAFLGTNYGNLGGIINLRCNTCHTVPTGSDRGFTPAIALQEPQDFKVPQLRNIYQKMRFTNAPGAQSLLGFGITHDGTDPSLFAFLSRSVFGVFANDAGVKRNLSAFVQCFDTGTAPAVGYARTITSGNVSSISLSNDWSMLEAQTVGGTNIDLIVQGTIEGQKHGFVFVTASNLYRGDKQSMAPLTRAALVAKVVEGGTLTVMGVPPGTGARIGIDHDGNGMPDGDEPLPLVHVTRSSSNAVISWPTNANGFVLETVTTVSAPNWSVETSLRAVLGGEFAVTNAPSATNRFFRLRQL